MSKKTNKTLFLPDWLIAILEREALNYEGPGTCAAAAIYAFSRLSRAAKIKAMKAYTAEDINISYAEKAAAEDEAAAARALSRPGYKPKSHARPPKAG